MRMPFGSPRDDANPDSRVSRTANPTRSPNLPPFQAHSRHPRRRSQHTRRSPLRAGPESRSPARRGPSRARAPSHRSPVRRAGFSRTCTHSPSSGIRSLDRSKLLRRTASSRASAFRSAVSNNVGTGGTRRESMESRSAPPPTTWCVTLWVHLRSRDYAEGFTRSALQRAAPSPEHQQPAHVLVPRCGCQSRAEPSGSPE